ncbi:hypothetical protein KC321_g68 [Hortaea werneckii]|nr:hypothetical protein KC321_g68 [Hortaea werneckii]
MEIEQDLHEFTSSSPTPAQSRFNNHQNSSRVVCALKYEPVLGGSEVENKAPGDVKVQGIVMPSSIDYHGYKNGLHLVKPPAMSRISICLQFVPFGVACTLTWSVPSTRSIFRWSVLLFGMSHKMTNGIAKSSDVDRRIGSSESDSYRLAVESVGRYPSRRESLIFAFRRLVENIMSEWMPELRCLNAVLGMAPL